MGSVHLARLVSWGPAAPTAATVGLFVPLAAIDRRLQATGGPGIIPFELAGAIGSDAILARWGEAGPPLAFGAHGAHLLEGERGTGATGQEPAVCRIVTNDAVGRRAVSCVLLVVAPPGVSEAAHEPDEMIEMDRGASPGSPARWLVSSSRLTCYGDDMPKSRCDCAARTRA
jgi:hypothetical protein